MNELYTLCLDHMCTLEDDRIQHVRNMMKGRPNEKEWNDALDGSIKTRETSYRNAQIALEEVFNEKSKI